MGLTSEQGRLIRKEYSEEKEKLVCQERGLTQMGGTRTKIDGTDGISNESIKNFSGKSTQVHLTTQKHFIEVLNLDEDSKQFVKLFCGNETINNKGKDRYLIAEIDSKYTQSFLNYLTTNKTKVIDLIIRNGFNITSVVYRNLKTNQLLDISYDEILNKIENCSWVAKKGGIHLKNKEGKSYFHFQREGKKSKTNRYNVLWHIHSHLFS